jgi:hypothetical protein
MALVFHLFGGQDYQRSFFLVFASHEVLMDETPK